MDPRQTIGYKNNNPLNIRFYNLNKWQGQIGDSRGFCKFFNMTYGIRAGIIILKKYIARGEDTIFKIIRIWAPPCENNTEAYIKNVSASVGIHRHTRIDIKDKDTICKIVEAMIKQECAGLKVGRTIIEKAYELAVRSK